MKYQKIYDNSPIWFQNIMATLYGYKTKKNRYKKKYYEHLNYLKEVRNYSRKELKKLQFQGLMSLLKDTIEKSSFYRKLYKKIDIDSFKSIEDFTSIA